MFYYKNWEDFCRWIKSNGITTYTAEQSLQRSGSKQFLILKHDVEDNVAKALILAKIEHKYGISGSYYVQAYLLNSAINIHMLRQMQIMGHEISYHYDVLDANNGDFEKAEIDFKKWLMIFKKEGFTFRTICQHGNPVKKRIGYSSNRDFFRNQGIRHRYSHLVDMVVNYSENVSQKYIYISDAGYIWKHITQPESNDLHPNASTITIGGFYKLKNYIDSNKCSVIVSTHPHRWEKSYLIIQTKIIIFKTVRVVARFLQKFPVAAYVMDRFYFLAKKI